MRHVRFNIWIVLLAVTVGCTRNVSLGEPDKPLPVMFNVPSVQPPTKTDPGVQNSEIPPTYNTAEHFSVYALDQEDGTLFDAMSDKSHYFMSNEECAYNSTYNAWEPLTPYYWPYQTAFPNFRLSFQAYSPSVAEEDCTAIGHDWDDGFTFTGFSPRTPGHQYDLLYSDIHKDKKRADFTPDNGTPYEEDSGDQASYSGIDLIFHHGLCSINFQIQAKVPEDAIQQIHLQKISVKNVWNKATFTQSDSQWRIDADADEVEYIAYQNTGTATQGQRLHEDLVPPFFSVPDILMLIPQDLAHDHDPLDPDDDKHVTIEVTYTRTIAATGKTVLATETADLVTGNNGGYFQGSSGSTPVTIDSWQMGHRYIYKLTLNLYKVFVDPDVQVWNDFNPEQNLDL